MEYIIMADVIDSSSKNGREVMEFFKELVSRTNKKFKDEIKSPLTITLGDEFQGIVKNLKCALDIITFMDEYLISSSRYLNLRYVLNHGEVDSMINKQNAYEMLGSGLSEARKLLEKLKKDRLKYKFFGLSGKLNEELDLIYLLIQTLYESWPDKDLGVVSKFIQYEDYKIVARDLKKDISSVWRKEKTLRMNDYFNLKKLVAVTIR